MLRRKDHRLRRAVVHDRRHGRCHLRLRHWNSRRSVVDGAVPSQVLPGRVPADAGRHAREQLLQVRQPAPHGVHVLALHRRPAHHLPRVARHGGTRPPHVHDPRRRGVPGRSGRGRRVGQHLHGHPRTSAPRRRPWVREPGRAAVPVGDGAGEVPRRVQQRVPAQRRDRRVGGQRGQLRHGEDQRRVGLARVAGARRRARRPPHPRRAVPPGDAQQPPAARQGPPRRRASASEDPRRGSRRRRRARRHRRGQQRRGRRRRPADDPHAAAVPAAARHGRDDPVLPAGDGDQRDRVLRAGAAAHHRHGRERVAAVGGGDRRRGRGVDVRVHAHRRPVRPPHSLPGRRRADAGVAGADRRHHGGGTSRQQRRREQGVGGGPHPPDRRVRGRVRVVVGPAGLAGAERDLPAGGARGGAERDGGRQLRVHRVRGAGVPGHALPHEGRDLLLLRRVARRHDRVRVPPPARDQGRAHRAGRRGVARALLLEQGRRARRWRAARGRETLMHPRIRRAEWRRFRVSERFEECALRLNSMNTCDTKYSVCNVFKSMQLQQTAFASCPVPLLTCGSWFGMDMFN